MKGYGFNIAIYCWVWVSLTPPITCAQDKPQEHSFFVYDQEVSPQVHQALQDKYWFYRHRLVTEFLNRGTSPPGVPSGFSIPACQAYKGADDMLHFGDGTSFLGNYIGVLATEFLLLQRSHANEVQLESVKEELFQAMKAYERLDINAECTVPPYKDSTHHTLNGFFLRDDVDIETFTQNFKGAYDVTGLLKPMVSDFDAAKQADPCTSDALRFPTVDQISNLLVGFALVVKCMGDESFLYDGELFHYKEKAKWYTHTIMTYMKEVNYLIEHPISGCPVRYNEGGYLLAFGLAHAAETIVEERFGVDPIVKVGFDKNNFTSYESSNTFLSSAVWQNNINYPQGRDFFRQNFMSAENERNGLMRFTDAVIGSGGLYEYTDAHDYNNAVVAQTMAVSNVLRIGVIPYTQKVKIFGKRIPLTCYDGNIPQYFIGALGSYTHRFPFLKVVAQVVTAVPILSVPCDNCLPELSLNTTALALSEYGDIADIQYFAALHQFLHGTGIYSYNHRFLLMLLQEAPSSGPHYKPYRDPYNPPSSGNWNDRSESEGSPWWRQDNRWEKSARTHTPDVGAWNGLDYMIAYNIFLLVNGKNYDLPLITLDTYKAKYLEPIAFQHLYADKVSGSVAYHIIDPHFSPIHTSFLDYRLKLPAARKFKLKYSLALFWHPVY